ncbi:MAG: hypothetical protein JWM26_3041 [Betaproteobacteria bacterium]|jgi:hypothetical protein|nr:hypothetical protein [Betaproteobacteria bacterium]
MESRADGLTPMSDSKSSASTPPDGLPVYRVLTGPDDAAFCRRVSDTLALGYLLYGAPAVTFNNTNVIVAQALIWPTAQKAIAKPKK